MKNIILLMCIIIILGCNNQESTQYKPTVIIGEVDLNKSYKLSDIVENVQLIPLETNDTCLIGYCSKILIDSSKIFISDNASKSLFIFNMSGKLI